MREVFREPLPQGPTRFIRQVSFCSPSEGYAIFQGVGLRYTADSGRSFIQKPITNSIINFNGYNLIPNTVFYPMGVTALSKDTFMVYGQFSDGPAILYSANQGASYRLSYYTDLDTSYFMDMTFSQDHSTGFAINEDRIVKTTDGGLNWTTVRLDYSSSDLNYLAGVDNNTLYAFCTGFNTAKLLKTVNSGLNWQTLNLPPGRIRYASFISPSVGWLSMISGTDSIVYYTNTGGLTFTPKNNPGVTPFAANKIKFINDSTGFGIGSLFTVFKTTDSGKVWEPLPRDNNFTYSATTHNDLKVYNNTQLWAGGGHGFLEINNSLGSFPNPKSFFKFDTSNVYLTGTVNLVNFSKPFYQYKWYVNNNLVSTNYHTSYTHIASHPLDTVKLVISFSGKSDSVTRYQWFSVPVPPVINSFVPSSGSIGTFIAIRGLGFTGVHKVRFGGVLASSFTIVNDTLITATVANGASGSVTVEYFYGLNVALPGFTYFPPTTAIPPSITSFSPHSGPAGSIVTINGVNFNTTAANNIVYFGAARAVVVSASATQLTVQVPTGATFKAFTILNTSTQLTGFSAMPFLVTFPGGGGPFTSTSFENVFSISSGLSWMIATSDFNDDGKPDIVITPNQGLRLSVYKNTSTISTMSFIPAGDYFTQSTGVRVESIGIADVDGDGKPDIVATRDSSFNSLGTVSILRNTSAGGNISFASPVHLIGGAAQGAISIRDIDGDGKPELVITYSQYVSPNVSNYSFSIYRNTSVPGFVSFAQRIDFEPNITTNGIEIADLDNDNIPDILVSRFHPNDSTFSIYKNVSTPGNFAFAPKKDYKTAAGYVQQVYVGDLEGDEKPDIIVSHIYTKDISSYRNTGTTGIIEFTPKKDFALSSISGGVRHEIGDLNGDGKLDFASGSNLFLDILNNQSAPGNIVFSPPATATITQSNGGSMCLADFDGDGKIDIAQTADLGLVQILRNKFTGSLAYAGPDAGICIGSSIQLGTSAVAGNTYSWTSNPVGFTASSANPAVTPTVTTSYFLTVSNGTNTAKDTVVISVNPFPSANAGADKTICASANTVIGTVATPSNSYSWTSNPSGFTSTSANPTVNPSVTTHYYLVVTTSFGCYAKDTIALTISSPVANAGSDKLVCPGNNTTIGIPVSGDTYSWTSSPAGFTSSVSNPTVSPTVNTTYFLTVTNSSFCIAKDTVIVTIDVPAVNAGTDKTICSGSTTAIGTPAIGTYTYSWTSNPLGFTSSIANPNVSPAVTTSYFLTVSNGNCTVKDTVIVNVNNALAPSITVVASTINICSGNSVTFTATPVNGGTIPLYQWQVNGINAGANSNTFTSAVLNNNDQIKVILTSSLSCVSPATTSSNIITMSVTALPIANAGNDVTICTGSTTQLNGSGGASYSWSPATGLTNSTIANPVATPVITTAYILTVLNGNCSSKDTVIVTVTPQVISPTVTVSTPNNNICSGTTTTFTAVATNGGTAPSYQWQINGVNAGSNSNSFTNSTLNNNDQVKVILTSNSACVQNPVTASNIITMAVQQLAIPVVTLNNRLYTVTNPDAAASYTWQVLINSIWGDVVPLANGTSYNAPAAGEYRVQANKGACTVYSIGQVTNFVNMLPVNNPFGIYLYPNPVNNVVTLDSIKLAQKWETIKVVNANGQQALAVINIKNQTTVSINVSDLKQGTYFIQLRKKDGEFITIKFVKI